MAASVLPISIRASASFRQGRSAWKAGITENPYPLDSFAHRAWAAGWQDRDGQDAHEHYRDEFNFERNYTNPE